MAVICNCGLGSAIVDRIRAKPWCVKGKTAAWRSTIKAKRWPLASYPKHQRKQSNLVQQWPRSGSEYRPRRTTPGGKVIKACSRQSRQRHWLDYALTLRPNGLRFRAQSNLNNNLKRDISNELRMGTFLKSFDTTLGLA